MDVFKGVSFQFCRLGIFNIMRNDFELHDIED